MPSEPSTDSNGQRKPRLRESALAQGLTFFAATLLASLTTKFGIDVTHSPSANGAISVVASAIGTGLAAGYGVFICWTKSKKIHRAESLIPGITEKTGPANARTVIENDPTTTDPPKVIVTPPPDGDASP